MGAGGGLGEKEAVRQEDPWVLRMSACGVSALSSPPPLSPRFLAETHKKSLREKASSPSLPSSCRSMATAEAADG